MAFPAAMIPLAVSAVRGLLRYRGQLDRVFVAKEAAADLPFVLPPAPDDVHQHIDEMKRFFAGGAGEAMLTLAGMGQTFARFPQVSDAELKELVRVYLESAGLSLEKVGPENDFRIEIAPGREQDARLAYFMVSSHRLSRNPTVTRVILATADTLLELAGENAAFLVADPKTAQVVSSLLREFAGEADIDDMSAELIVRRLLGAAVVAAVDNRGSLPDHPALSVLYGALADVRRRHGAGGANFVNEIITRDGFQQVVASYLTTAATDERFLSAAAAIATGREDGDPLAGLARRSFAALLDELGSNLPRVLDDARALSGVLEAALAAAASDADAVIGRELGDEPLLAVVLKSVSHEVARRAGAGSLVAQITTGDLWAALFDVSLAAVAANPGAIRRSADVDSMVAKLVAGLADVVAQRSVGKIVEQRGHGIAREALARGLEVLASEPEFVAGNDAFAVKVVGAVLEAAAPLVEDGLQSSDLLPVFEAAVGSAAGNLALVEMDDRLRVALAAFGTSISEGGAARLLTRETRRDALLAALDAVAANPALWGRLADAQRGKTLTALARGIVAGLTQDPTRLLTGPVLVDAFRGVLVTLGRQGADWVGTRDAPEEVQRLLSSALETAGEQVGKTIDGENLPAFLERVVTGFLRAPFAAATDAGKPKIAELLGSVIDELEAA